MKRSVKYEFKQNPNEIKGEAFSPNLTGEGALTERERGLEDGGV